MASTTAALAEDGAQLYGDHCSACHQMGGEGTPNLAPPLVSPVIAAAAKAGAADYLAKVVLNGLSGPIEVEGRRFVSAMPAQPDLSDAEIAALVAHVLVGLNGVAADRLPDAAAVARLRQNPVGHGELRRIREGFAR